MVGKIFFNRIFLGNYHYFGNFESRATLKIEWNRLKFTGCYKFLIVFCFSWKLASLQEFSGLEQHLLEIHSFLSLDTTCFLWEFLLEILKLETRAALSWNSLEILGFWSLTHSFRVQTNICIGICLENWHHFEKLEKRATLALNSLEMMGLWSLPRGF